MVHAADKAERPRCRLLRQDDAKPWSKEQAAIKIDDLPLREVRGLLTLDGLASGSRTEQAAAMPSHNKRPLIFSGERSAVSAVYSPLAFVSSMCTYSAQASQSRAAALSFGIRLLARPTPRQPALRNSGMFSGVTPPMAT